MRAMTIAPDSRTDAPPTVAVFSPDPLLSITIEHDTGTDDIHLHAAGQGVWVARMAAELGALPGLCGLAGSEAGTVLAAVLAAAGCDWRPTAAAGGTGTYVVDRRSGERTVIAAALRPAPHRHEVDDLVSNAVTSALAARVLVVCNPYPPEHFPVEAYSTLVGDVRGAGIPIVVDLSTPWLDATLPHHPDLVKINDWELAEYISGPVDGPRALTAVERLLSAGARAVAITRAGDPILVATETEPPYEIVPPRFPAGHREGCGDAMTGAIAAALARGLTLRDALMLGAAAGSANFLRHGLGTGRRATVEELRDRVTARALDPAPRLQD
jgi:1-phosphofructokinase